MIMALSQGQDDDFPSKEVSSVVCFYYFTGMIVVMTVTKETNYDGPCLLKNITRAVNNTMRIHHATQPEVKLSVSTGGLSLSTYTSSNTTGTEVTVVPVFIKGGDAGDYASTIVSCIATHLNENNSSSQNFEV